MNHGHFFQLNQYLSKLADGIAVYDYTELPAYKERNRNNPMSPKYPINLVITSDTVCFKMHYCAFRNNNNPPDYNYTIGGKLSKDIQLVHVEDVILELPFAEIPTKDLTDIVKSAYIANFPQVSADNGPENNDPEKTGSRFIDKLINDWSDSQDENKSTVSYSTLWLMDLFKDGKFILYESDNKVIGSTNDDTATGSAAGAANKGMVTKFLRKLLLDFMFDLKHSSVFCTSMDYNNMYNGLMSNYYFSALMHKCEFFYYRELTIRAIKERHRDEDSDKQITLLYAQELFKAEELWAADIRNPLSDIFFEQKFPNDFKNSKYLKGRQATEFGSNVLERMTTTRWDSWFANPEEEMRRIYFIMKENGVKHICNSIVLAEYLAMDKSEDNIDGDTVNAMALSARQNRGNTSRWFLNRYDFNDVLHLHFFKWANPCWVFFLGALLLLIWGAWSIPLIQEDQSSGLKGVLYLGDIIQNTLLSKYKIWTFVALGAVLIVLGAIIKRGHLFNDDNDPLVRSFKRFQVKRVILIVWVVVCLLLLPYNLLHTDNYHVWLYAFLIIIPCAVIVFMLVSNALLRLGLISLLISLIVLYCWWHKYISINNWTIGDWALAIMIALACVYLFIDSKFLSKKQKEFRKPSIHPIESWHLLLPKLVASITAAWLTISMGFDVLVAFFDSHVVWSTMSIIIIVVFSFILYQIDRELPKSSDWLKVYRTIEMFFISYSLSFCIGIIIINFVGERYLERSGFLTDYYEEHIYEHGAVKFVILTMEDKDTVIDVSALESAQEKIKLFSHNYTKLYLHQDSLNIKPIEQVITHKRIIFSKQDLFILQDFLIMFSFVAMFIGVFLQMVFFDRKKMTEF